MLLLILDQQNRPDVRMGEHRILVVRRKGVFVRAAAGVCSVSNAIIFRQVHICSFESQRDLRHRV